jgi:hypothetical protein
MKFEVLLEFAKSAAEALNKPWDEKLVTILEYCWNNLDSGAFPKISKFTLKEIVEKGLHEDLATYMKGYVRRYYNDRAEKLGLREVQTCQDPAINVILEAFADLKDFSTVTDHHRQSMAAENLLGKLLERYIAARLEPYNWIWCAGNTVRSVDFLYKDKGSNSFFALQIKNRSNSENSSSSAIRKGTSITKWHRIDANTGKTNWESFPYRNSEVTLGEDDFHNYIKEYAKSIK